MYQSVKATAISLRPKKWDKGYNADKLEAAFVEASKENPDVMVATEGVLDGYVVMAVIEDPGLEGSMLELAEPIDGSYIGRFRQLAKKLMSCLVFGFAERIGDEVYNAAIFIDNDGEIRGKHHKAMLAEGTTESWRFNRAGRVLRAFDTPIGRAGIMICNERWSPSIARALVLDGAQLLFISSYGSKSRAQNKAVLARSRENGVPIIEANVGMNLIISKGEIVAYKWGVDKITTAVIEVPAPPSASAARDQEAEYMALQGPEMQRRHYEGERRRRGEDNLMSLAERGELIAGRAEILSAEIAM